MNLTKKFQAEDEAIMLKEKIIQKYEKFNVRIDIKKYQAMKDRFIFLVKMKGNTREAHLRAHATDVQLRLKVPLFCVERDGLCLYLVVSRKEIEYAHLPELLQEPDFQKSQKRMDLPHIVGDDVLGDTVIEDLSQFPHLLLGGSTNSGKSVGLQTLITSIAYAKSPSKVNFVVIDVGATDLMVFEELPHLACPVVQDRTTAAQVLAALVLEMERRIDLKRTSYLHFLLSPRLVLVIDEFPALFMGLDKSEAQVLIANISTLLQRGRHAKIHVVLAAQNPTFQNMKVDLGNITTRIAFRCAKKNFSETILDEGGAENLAGQGDMLLKSPQHSDLQRIQGAYISPEELRYILRKIVRKYSDVSPFVLDISKKVEATQTSGKHLTCSVVGTCPSADNQLLADVILWALEKNTVSINALAHDHHLGWNRAANFMKQLERIGITDKPCGKQARNVRPKDIKYLSPTLIAFLNSCGHSRDAIVCAFQKRSAPSERKHLQRTILPPPAHRIKQANKKEVAKPL